MNNKVYFNLLTQMVYDFESYFQEDIAKTILDKIPLEELKSHLFSNSIDDYICKCNFWSLIQYKNAGSYEHNNEKNNYAKKQQEIINTWDKVLKKKDASLVEDISYEITHMHQKINIGLNPLIIKRSPRKWVEDSEKYTHLTTLSNTDKLFIALDSFKKDSEYKLASSPLKREGNAYFMNNFIEQSKHVKKWYSISESEWQKKLVSNRFVLENAYTLEKEELFIFLGKNVLKDFVKESNKSLTMKENPHLLSSILKIAPPDTWVKECFDLEHKNPVLHFFDKKFQKHKGVSLLDNKELAKTQKKSSVLGNEIMSIIDYLSPSIQKIIKPEEAQIWYEKLMKNSDKSLFLFSLNYFPLPEVSEKTEEFYEKFTTLKPSINSKTYNQLYSDFKKEKLFDKLSTTIDPKEGKTKTIKI